MAWYKRRKRGMEAKREATIQQKTEQLNQDLDGTELDDSLSKNLTTIRELFENTDNLVIREIQNKGEDKPQYAIVFCDGLVDSQIINENIVRPLIVSDINRESENIVDTLMNQVLFINEVKKSSCLKELIGYITYGDTILFTEGAREAIILNTKGFTVRAIAEPDNEKILLGPREGFSESLMTNMSLIQRKLRTNQLKMRLKKLGKRTNTSICVIYIEGLVKPKVLSELYRRLNKVDIDGILDTNYINELIDEERHSPFRTLGYTERPDVVVGKILEGRVAVLVDGSPVALTLPYLFIENFQSGEDYYMSSYYTSFERMLRILGFFLTISVPAIYIAIVAFHHEMLPTSLLISLTTESANIPFPAIVEILVMVLVFDILRETGVRMPTGVGQALSIVGALVVGQAAVEAKLVAAATIIVVGLTGITNLLVPKINAAIIYVRLLLLLLAGSFGFFGYTLGISYILIHLLSMKSFGTDYIFSESYFQYQYFKDIFFRAPWWRMRTRPDIAEDKVRMNDTGGDENE